jgi:hypothetical protein
MQIANEHLNLSNLSGKEGVPAGERKLKPEQVK